MEIRKRDANEIEIYLKVPNKKKRIEKAISWRIAQEELDSEQDGMKCIRPI